MQVNICDFFFQRCTMNSINKLRIEKMINLKIPAASSPDNQMRNVKKGKKKGKERKGPK